MTDYVFVYGTLKRGEPNQTLMCGTRYVADGILNNAGLIDLGGFPGLVLGHCWPKDFAKGEIYEILDNDVISTLDRLESVGHLYTRVMIPVAVIGVPSTLLCWTYILLTKVPEERLVQGGSWSWGDKYVEN